MAQKYGELEAKATKPRLFCIYNIDDDIDKIY